MDKNGEPEVRRSQKNHANEIVVDPDVLIRVAGEIAEMQPKAEDLEETEKRSHSPLLLSISGTPPQDSGGHFGDGCGRVRVAGWHT